MIFHENRLPADDFHEISCLICYFGKSSKILNCRLLQIIDGPLWVNKFKTTDLPVLEFQTFFRDSQLQDGGDSEKR